MALPTGEVLNEGERVQPFSMIGAIDPASVFLTEWLFMRITGLRKRRQPARPSMPGIRNSAGYHWFVLIVASLGWLFDTMDQQLFNIARVPAMRALLGRNPAMRLWRASSPNRPVTPP